MKPRPPIPGAARPGRMARSGCRRPAGGAKAPRPGTAGPEPCAVCLQPAAPRGGPGPAFRPQAGARDGACPPPPFFRARRLDRTNITAPAAASVAVT